MTKIEPGELTVRAMEPEDLETVIAIDERVTGVQRLDYFEGRLRRGQRTPRTVVTALVAEVSDRVVGFIMGEIFEGQYGIPESAATLDTIGVDPAFRRQLVAKTLFDEFAANLRQARVTRLQTLVNLRDSSLIKFFDGVGFRPAKTLNLELDL